MAAMMRAIWFLVWAIVVGQLWLPTTAASAYGYTNEDCVSECNSDDGITRYLRYGYCHNGLCVAKTVNGVTTRYHYDIDGRLIAETDTGGSTLREYAWDDAVPIAQFTGGAVTYLHTDRLGTPRIGTDQAGMDVWRWEPEAFGTTAPTGTVTINLRYAGQYFDSETGLHQNWHRTYDPGSGRYLESGPGCIIGRNG